MTIRDILIKLSWLLSSQFGLNPRHFLRSLYGIPRYLRDLRRFRKGYSGTLTLMPCLHDWHEEGGVTKSEYFWQDLLVARWIFEAKPQRHVDIGSRVDGFVAHVASFREIEMFDVRPITTQIPGVVFKRADLLRREGLPNAGGYDSLSCLHAIEHFGLGRYGDPINPDGHELGIENMTSLLAKGGTFYLSAPIGRERVEFNAHRISDPRTIIRLVECHGLRLRKLVVFGSGMAREIDPNPENLQALAEATYNLGIFVFNKP
jgi:hypothetical protein